MVGDPFERLRADDEQTASSAPSSRGLIWIAAIVTFIALTLGLAIYGQRGRSSASAASGIALGGPFTLSAPDGHVFTEANLAGKPYALYFGYTRCPDVCPTSLARLARLRKRLGVDGGKFAIVFVSVDPAHDKPADIGRYVAMFGTPIIGLTGTPAQLKPMEKNWGVYVNQVPQAGGDYTIDHSAVTYLMGADGRFAALLDPNESDDAALAELRRLVG